MYMKILAPNSVAWCPMKQHAMARCDTVPCQAAFHGVEGSNTFISNFVELNPTRGPQYISIYIYNKQWRSQDFQTLMQKSSMGPSAAAKTQISEHSEGSQLLNLSQVHYNYHNYYIIYMTICPDSLLIVDYVALCFTLDFNISLFV